MNPAAARGTPQLARKLGLFDTTMLVMGGIIGAGIFINPYVVAEQVHTPALILGAWMVGGALAMLGAFIYAELAQRMPQVGGQYAYMRQAYHPLVAFLYGWVLLLVIQTGGMAAVTIAFARYLAELTGLRASEWITGIIALSVLTLVNCLGVRSGGTVQSTLMALKIIAIGAFVIAGFIFVPAPALAFHPVADRPFGGGIVSAFGAAMVPVLFAYGGWQTANFVAGEMKSPERDLARGLLLGVAGVVVIYTSVNYICLRDLGASGLAATHTPASAVMKLADPRLSYGGMSGTRFLDLAITLSALGFLSQSILTAPRVYFAMAEDQLLFKQIAWVHPVTRVPIFAIVLQSVWTMIIVLSGTFEQILNYVVSMDFLFFGITASCLFVWRARKFGQAATHVPGHPATTAFFCAACAFIVLNTIYRYPANTLIGVGILLSGIPVYFLWGRQRTT